MGKPVKYIGAWSISKLHTFETCRAQYKRRYIDKLPEPPSPALINGTKVHEEIEAWLNGWLEEPPVAVEAMLDDFEELKESGVTTEQMWAHHPDWTPLEDGFDKRAWIRAKTDAFRDDGDIVTVYDWKTGRKRDINRDSVRFYGLLALLRNPKARYAALELWYVDAQAIEAGEIMRGDIESVKDEFNRRAKRIYAEELWPEEAGLHCRWCPFRKNIGGPCAY